MVKRMPDRKYAYFRDDQITFLITHPEGEITIDQLNNFTEKILQYLDGATITWLPSQIVTFPRATGFQLEEQASIISNVKEDLIKQNREYNPSDYESDLFKDEQDQSKVAFSIIVGNINAANQEGIDPLVLIQTIRRLRENITNLSNDELAVKSVSPNWLMGNASQGGSTGGPGGLPTPFKGTDIEGGRRYFINIENFGGLSSSGENVDVAILDTAPCPHDLVIAHKEGKDNPLIQTLLGPEGKLHVYWATYAQLLRMYNTSFNSHDYKMSDHGLFAAGIIHSIVPKATIHLIEVLNPFGVGDLLTLAEGFKTVYHDIYKPDATGKSERKLVVNCSLMLELPIEEKHCYADSKKKPAVDREPADNVDDVAFEQEVLKLVTEDPQPIFEINELCKKLFCVGRQVVAAAGNDWENGKARKRRSDLENNQQQVESRLDAPVARYPAAFASVVGVGALPRNSKVAQHKHKASTYSNKGDKPTGDAIMTLGGEEGEKEGVLGLYLAEKFPERYDANDKNKIRMIERKVDQNEDNHWAWWAGTSFATPVLTGTIAAVLSSALVPGNTQEAIRILYNNKIILDNQTEAQEDVMEVKQGPRPPGP